MYTLLRDGTVLGEINDKQLADTCLTLAGGGFTAGETERQILKDHGFNANKPLEGHYKGQQEQAWLVCINGQEDRRKLVDLCRRFNQESILFSGIDRTCHLHYIDDGKEELVGVLTEVREEFAKAQDSYTYDSASEKYWVTL